MVAVCDDRYNISAYFPAPQMRERASAGTRLSLQSGSVCVSAECRQAELRSGITFEWKCDALDLLSAATEVRSSDWRSLYSAMLITLPPSFVAREVPELEGKFSALAEEWRKETALLSSMEAMAMHPAYQRIIGMGPAVLPLILSELSREPDHWFWALCAITGENPVRPEDAGNLAKMTEAWLELGRRRRWR